jgi:hypothetical protein
VSCGDDQVLQNFSVFMKITEQWIEFVENLRLGLFPWNRYEFHTLRRSLCFDRWESIWCISGSVFNFLSEATLWNLTIQTSFTVVGKLSVRIPPIQSVPRLLGASHYMSLLKVLKVEMNVNPLLARYQRPPFKI